MKIIALAIYLILQFAFIPLSIFGVLLTGYPSIPTGNKY